MIKIQINNICAKLIECEPLTSGMIGKTLDVEFSAEWQNYTKTAVFSNGDTTIDVLESQWDGNTITIPAEVLSIAGRTVIFGMYGFAVENGTTVAIPTIYARIGIPMVGADPESDPTTDPSLPVYAQLQWQIDHFEISDEQIAEQIQEYLEEHPIEIPTASASVLGGIKVGDGLSVTADGTLSADVTADDLDDYALKSDLEQLQTGVITCLNDIKTLLSNVAYVDYDASDMLAQLAEDIEDLGGVVPEEPITITFDGTTAKISGLNSLNITYSGTTAEIGGE